MICSKVTCCSQKSLKSFSRNFFYPDILFSSLHILKCYAKVCKILPQNSEKYSSHFQFYTISNMPPSNNWLNMSEGALEGAELGAWSQNTVGGGWGIVAGKRGGRPNSPKPVFVKHESNTSSGLAPCQQQFFWGGSNSLLYGCCNISFWLMTNRTKTA